MPDEREVPIKVLFEMTVLPVCIGCDYCVSHADYEGTIFKKKVFKEWYCEKLKKVISMEELYVDTQTQEQVPCKLEEWECEQDPMHSVTFRYNLITKEFKYSLGL